jgi:hypothetical protein
MVLGVYFPGEAKAKQKAAENGRVKYEFEMAD